MLVLDTNILLIKLRLDSRWATIEQTFLKDDNRNLISVVTLGELHALALKNNWGKVRSQKISFIRQDFIVVDMNLTTTLRSSKIEITCIEKRHN